MCPFEPLPTHALAFSLLRMTQAEGHRSFDLRLVIDCSLPNRRIDRLSTGRCSAGVAVGFACSGLEWRRIGRPALPSRWPSRPRRRALPSEGRGREFESRRVRQCFQCLIEERLSSLPFRGSAGEARGNAAASSALKRKAALAGLLARRAAGIRISIDGDDLVLESAAEPPVAVASDGAQGRHFDHPVVRHRLPPSSLRPNSNTTPNPKGTT